MKRFYPRNLIEYLEEGAVCQSPERVAFRDGDRRYTFAHVRAAARQIGEQLAGCADVFNRPIAVFLPKCAETLIADLGIFYSGNAYLNLDVQAPPTRMEALLASVAPAVIVNAAAARAFATL